MSEHFNLSNHCTLDTNSGRGEKNKVRTHTRRFKLTVRLFILTLMILGTMILAPSLVSADDGDTSHINQNLNGIEIGGFGDGEATMVAFNAPNDENILFEQALISCNASWEAITSATNLGYLCMDDFWGLSKDITDIHLYGFAMNYSAGWWSCDPTGIEFEIIFYEDSSGTPGAIVETFSDINPTIVPLDSCFPHQLYRFDVDSLPNPVNLAEGWVSVQSTYSPNGCSLLWLNSPDGNSNAIQESDVTDGGLVNENLAFILTGQDMPVGGTAYSVDMSGILVIAGTASILFIGLIVVLFRRRTA